MELYNTLTQRKEAFQPKGDQVSIYMCGITPYDTTHLGHAFTYTSMDVLIRYLKLLGKDVEYVQNVTDVDDDILRKARLTGEDWDSLGNRWTRHYIEDMVTLNVLPPDHLPRATDFVDQIIDRVKSLLERGVAYQVGGNVYYSVDAWPDFGKLCHLPRTEMLPIANERGNYPDDPNKRDPLDFVLWQAQAPGEPGWDSPWGKGRPGWHIECSTMATELLDKQIDIHGGGADLCFPHHEAEIAQVEPVTGKEPFARFWVHTAMVRYQGEKMSKSLGNLIWMQYLLQRYSPDAIRLYLANHHYREPWEYDEDDLKKAEQLAHRIQQAVTIGSGQGVVLNPDVYWASFTDRMDDDLDSPGAIKVIRSFVDELIESAQGGQDVREAQDTLKQFGWVFGLRMDKSEPDQQVVNGWENIREDFEESEQSA